jgi:hypothetical protein
MPKLLVLEPGPSQEEMAEQAEIARAEIAKEASVLKQENIVEPLSERDETEDDLPDGHSMVSGELINLSQTRTLKNVRKNLNKTDKTLSKVIHQPIVRAVSETSSNTVSRPSGLLGGGIVALAGSSTYYYFAKHIGFKYNYLVFILLFIGGYLVGLAIELIVFVVKGKRRSLD